MHSVCCLDALSKTALPAAFELADEPLRDRAVGVVQCTPGFELLHEGVGDGEFFALDDCDQ